LLAWYDGTVPRDRSELLELPGVVERDFTELF